MIHIRLNGENKTLSANLSLAELITQIPVDPRTIAVAKNLEVIPHSQWEQFHLSEGDEIEIFQAVGGG